MSEAGTQRIADDGEPAVARRSFAERLVGAFRLDGSVYEEVANDPRALAHAAGVVACAAAAGAIGVSSFCLLTSVFCLLTSRFCNELCPESCTFIIRREWEVRRTWED